MPQVPVLAENRQQLRGLSDARFDAPDIGAGGRQIGEAIERGGRTLAVAAEQEDEIRTLYAEARAKELDNEYQEFERETLFGEDGYYNSLNASAVDRAEPTTQSIRQKQAELLARTGDRRERMMLESVFQRRSAEAMNGIARHRATQARSFAVEQSASRIENASDNYARYYDSDPDQAQANKDTVLSEVMSLAQLNGWSDPDIIKSKREEALTGLHKGYIDAMLEGDPAKASAYLQEHRGEMDPAVAFALEGRLMPLMAEQDSINYADMASELATRVVEGPAPDLVDASQPAPARGPLRATVVAVNRSARPANISRNPAPFPNSYRAPLYDTLDKEMETKYGLRPGLLTSIRVNGERSNNNQVSGAGARGPYQFIPSTRQGFISRYGIDPWRSPREQVEAAAIHLRDDIVNHGSEAAAVAGYNGGPTAARAVASGRQAPAAETRNYLNRVLGDEGGGRAASLPGNPDPETVAASDLATQLEWAETFIPEHLSGKPPRYVQMVVDQTQAEIKRRYDMKMIGARAEREAATDAAMEHVLALGDSFTSLAQIPGSRNLPIETRMQLQNAADANRKALAGGGKIETNWENYARYQTMTPEQLRRVPLDELRTNLGDTEFKEIAKERGGAAKPEKALTFNDILTVSAPSLASAGLSLTGKTGREKQRIANQRSEYLRDMTAWAERWKARTGKYPDEQQIQVQSDKMLVQMTWGDGEGFAFEAPNADAPGSRQGRVIVPDEIAARIRRAAPNASDAEVRTLYMQGRGVHW